MVGSAGLKVLIALALVFFSIGASAADFAVTMAPKDINGIPLAYKDELLVFQIKVVNFGAQKITGLNIQVDAESELSIIDNAAERQRKTFAIEQVKPGEVAVIDFLLKAKAGQSEKAIVSANYGIENYDNAVVAFLRIIPSNIDIAVKAQKSSFAPMEENKLLLNVSNNSEKPILGIHAELVLPNDFETDSNTFTQPELLEKQKIKNQEFEFRSKELAQGKRRIALLVSFTDEKGRHTLDKAVNVEVKSPSLEILLAILVVALAVAGFLVLKKGEPKQKTAAFAAAKPAKKPVPSPITTEKKDAATTTKTEAKKEQAAP